MVLDDVGPGEDDGDDDDENEDAPPSAEAVQQQQRGKIIGCYLPLKHKIIKTMTM